MYLDSSSYTQAAMFDFKLTSSSISLLTDFIYEAKNIDSPLVERTRINENLVSCL